MMRLILATSLTALLGYQATAQADTEEVYTWSDSQGQVHYSSQPSKTYPSTRISTRSSALPATKSTETATENQPAAATETQQQLDEEVRKQVLQDTQRLREQCKNLRSNLAQLKNNPRLMAEVEGKMVRLSEDDRQNRISETQQQLDTHCKGL